MRVKDVESSLRMGAELRSRGSGPRPRARKGLSHRRSKHAELVLPWAVGYIDWLGGILRSEVHWQEGDTVRLRDVTGGNEAERTVHRYCVQTRIHGELGDRAGAK